MSLYDAFGDVEAEPDTSTIILGQLQKPFEDFVQLVGWDPRTGVAYGEAQVTSGALGAHGDLAAWRCELDRVTEKVDEHLKDARRIECRHGQRRHELNRKR